MKPLVALSLMTSRAHTLFENLLYYFSYITPMQRVTTLLKFH